MSEKFLIRSATLHDAVAIQAIYAPYVMDTAITFEETPPSVVEMRERMASILPSYPWLVYAEQGEILGYAYACQHRSREAYRWSVDVAIYLKQGLGGRGIGRKLYEPLLDILKSQGYVNAFAGITLPNAASVGIHETLGFTPIGIYENVGFKIGSWHDVGWWQLAFEKPAVPEEPKANKY